MAELSEAGRARIEKAKAWVLKRADEGREPLRLLQIEMKKAMAEATRDVRPDQASFSPGQGQWSIDQVLRHLGHAHRGCAGLVLLLAHGKAPQLQIEMGHVPEDPMDFDAVKEKIAESFDKLAKASGALNGDSSLDTTYAHPWFGDLNAPQWLAFCAVHTRAHLLQIERIKGAPGYPA